MKTLIIHPYDHSTTFLDIVYKNIPNKTVVQGNVSKSQIKKLIEEHDRVMMMGHGGGTGLFAIGNWIPDEGSRYYGGFIIDETMVPLLQEKDNSVFIWCNADIFVNRHKLKGFYSGMFISEVGEAFYCSKDKNIDSMLSIKLSTANQEEVNESNYGFVNIIGKYINEDTETIYTNVKQEYGILAENNPIATYNHERLYKF